MGKALWVISSPEQSRLPTANKRNDNCPEMERAILMFLFLMRIHSSEANCHFRGPRLFQLGGPSGKFATTDVMHISTTRARYIQ